MDIQHNNIKEDKKAVHVEHLVHAEMPNFNKEELADTIFTPRKRGN